MPPWACSTTTVRSSKPEMYARESRTPLRNTGKACMRNYLLTLELACLLCILPYIAVHVLHVVIRYTSGTAWKRAVVVCNCCAALTLAVRVQRCSTRTTSTCAGARAAWQSCSLRR